MNMNSVEKEFVPALPSRATRKINMRSRVSVRSGLIVKLPADEFRSRILYCESKLERNFLMLWLAHNLIFDLIEQPSPIIFVDRLERNRKHTFDFLVVTHSRRRIAVIVKNHQAAQKESFMFDVNAITSQLSAEVADDVILFTDVSYKRHEAINAERLFKLRGLISQETEDAIHSAIRKSVGFISVAQLLRMAGYPLGGFGLLLRMLFDGRIYMQSAGILTQSSLITKAVQS